MEDAEDILTSGRLSSVNESVTQCRICLGEEIKELKNPIITPCKCKGTMKYIHLECLRAWIKQRVEIKEKQSTTIITWKSLNCELCKSPYPFAVYFNGHIYELINYKKPIPPYAIFEHYTKEGSDSTGICIITFSTKQELRIVKLNIYILGTAQRQRYSSQRCKCVASTCNVKVERRWVVCWR